MQDIDSDDPTPGAAAGALRRRLRATRVVFANPALRNCQLALGLARSVDLAHLVAVSAFLYSADGLRAVAAHGVIRAVVPAAGVPVVTAATGRFGHGRLLTVLGAVAAAATSGMITLVVLDGPVAATLALAGLAHVAIGAFRPVAYALMPALVRTPEELVGCTAAAGFVDGATTLFGPLLAGVLLAATGPEWALAAAAVLLVVAALLGERLPIARATAAEPRASRSGLRAFFGTPAVALVGTLGLFQTFVRGAMYVIVVVFTVEVLLLDVGAVGLLLGAIGVGGMLGLPVALAIVGRSRLYRSYGWGLALWGMPLALAAALPELGVALVLFAVVGLGNDLVDVSTFSALPRAVPERVLPTVLGVLESMYQVGMALGAAAGGILLSMVDARTALAVVGLLLPVLAVLAAPWLRRFDAVVERRDREVELLRRQPRFAAMPISVLDGLATRLVPVAFRPGETIVAEGGRCGRYVLIVDGSVRIERSGVPVAELRAGDALGGTELLRDRPRATSAVASGPVTAMVLHREPFLAAVEGAPAALAEAGSSRA